MHSIRSYHGAGEALIRDCTIIGHITRAMTTVNANIIGCTFISNSVDGNWDLGGSLIVPSGTRAGYDQSCEAMRKIGAKRVAHFDPYPSSELSGTIGGLDQLGFEAVRVAWRASHIGPEIAIYQLPPRKALAER